MPYPLGHGARCLRWIGAPWELWARKCACQRVRVFVRARVVCALTRVFARRCVLSRRRVGACCRAWRGTRVAWYARGVVRARRGTRAAWYARGAVRAWRGTRAVLYARCVVRALCCTRVVLYARGVVRAWRRTRVASHARGVVRARRCTRVALACALRRALFCFVAPRRSSKRRLKIWYTSRFVRVILAQGPC